MNLAPVLRVRFSLQMLMQCSGPGRTHPVWIRVVHALVLSTVAVPDSAATMQTERVFAELKSLAEERSSEKRLDLLRKIADLFFARIDEHSEAETSLFNEVIEQVVDQISHDGKIVVATDLA